MNDVSLALTEEVVDCFRALAACWASGGQRAAYSRQVGREGDVPGAQMHVEPLMAPVQPPHCLRAVRDGMGPSRWTSYYICAMSSIASPQS